jgi:hypothetical protein
MEKAVALSLVFEGPQPEFHFIGLTISTYGVTISTYGANHTGACAMHHKVTSPYECFQGLVSSNTP